MTPGEPDPELDAGPVTEDVGLVASEFAAVSVSVDTRGNGRRLRLEDRRSGAVRYLDALELECIVWAPEDWIRDLLDPSRHRWRDIDPGPAGQPPDGPRPGSGGS